MTDTDRLHNELAHAREIIKLIDSGEWTAPAEFREHYAKLEVMLEKYLSSKASK